LQCRHQSPKPLSRRCDESGIRGHGRGDEKAYLTDVNEERQRKRSKE